MSWRPRIRRRPIVAALLGASLVAGHLSSSPAHAILAGCSTDPLIALSNGVTMQVSVTIAADPANVSAITYWVHVPAGVSATSIINTPDLIGAKERIKLRADNAAGIYTTDTDVSTKPDDAAVGVTMALSSAGGPTVSTSASGQSKQHLVTTLTY